MRHRQTQRRPIITGVYLFSFKYDRQVTVESRVTKDPYDSLVIQPRFNATIDLVEFCPYVGRQMRRLFHVLIDIVPRLNLSCMPSGRSDPLTRIENEGEVAALHFIEQPKHTVSGTRVIL